MTAIVDLSQFDGLTPGPWWWDEQQEDIRGADGTTIVETDSQYYPPFGADRAAIVSVPALIAEVRSLRAENDRLRKLGETQ